ncbi:hypothetical protein GCM10007385_36630 [Tateyamaria omphalii]|nr:hypothetical protein GCM10007385_36630 [Tateyamaria omphalii]
MRTTIPSLYEHREGQGAFVAAIAMGQSKHIFRSRRTLLLVINTKYGAAGYWVFMRRAARIAFSHTMAGFTILSAA